jgi:hypothetical protein
MPHNMATSIPEMDYSLVAVVLVICFTIYKFWARDPRRKYLPPHVRGWPIINQTFKHLDDNPSEHLQKWSKEYGEIFRTTSATTTFVWLNSRKANKELIDRKSGIYSSRHPMPLLFDVASGGNRIVFMPYGKKWRSLRTIIHKVIPSGIKLILVIHASAVTFVYADSII